MHDILMFASQVFALLKAEDLKIKNFNYNIMKTA